MSPAKIGLITDSTCDIPAELRERYQIQVVPLTVVWDGEQYLDGVELSAEAFYERLQRDPTHPTTSQPAPSAFLEAFERARQAGAQELVVCTISSAMSGTLESARQAAALVDYPVHLHDSRTNSMGLGWQVLAAARARETGGDAAAMLAAADRARRGMVYVISLDTMEYLSRGGRIGGAVRFLESIIHIKPQITVNHETGKAEAGMPARSRKSALEGLYKDFFSRIHIRGPLHVTVLHNAAYDEARALAGRITAQYPAVELFIQIVSPILGVHTGPRAVALVGHSEDGE
jgi:DegV family protein with EDD domain